MPARNRLREAAVGGDLLAYLLSMGRGAGTTTDAPAPRGSADWLARARASIARLGFESYEVGGSLRDELLGRETKDLDVCVVGATLEELLERLDQEGKAARLEVAGRTIGARLYAPWTPKGGIELALARREVSTGPGHKDFDIIAAPDVTLEEDLKRRDFTCNALARPINPDGSAGELIDHHGGVEDINNGVLRAVGPTTIAEDPLRVLRGLARMSKDGLTPDAATREAMIEEIGKLGPDGPLSAERVFDEMQKLMGGRDAAKALRFARDAGIFEAVFPELTPMVGFNQESKYHDMTVDEHSFQALERACEWEAPLAVRWAALLHDSGKPKAAFRGKDGHLHFYANPDDENAKPHEEHSAEITSALLRRLKAPKALEEKVTLLVAEHMYGEDRALPKRSERRNAYKARCFMKRVGRENVDDLLLLRRCDSAGKRGSLKEGWDATSQAFEALVAEQRNAPLSVKELAIDGHDLMELGIEGRKIGEVQRELLQRVITDPEHNKRERLLSWAERLA